MQTAASSKAEAFLMAWNNKKNISVCWELRAAAQEINADVQEENCLYLPCSICAC